MFFLQGAVYESQHTNLGSTTVFSNHPFGARCGLFGLAPDVDVWDQINSFPGTTVVTIKPRFMYLGKNYVQVLLMTSRMPSDWPLDLVRLRTFCLGLWISSSTLALRERQEDFAHARTQTSDTIFEPYFQWSAETCSEIGKPQPGQKIAINWKDETWFSIFCRQKIYSQQT